MKLWKFVFWLCAVGLLRIIFRSKARVRATFYEPLPTGAFIISLNHISHFDPPLITTSFPRKVDWLAMKELFSTKASRYFFTMLNVIPVDRGGADRSGLRVALKRLREGRVVAIFPEGGIRDGDKSIVNGASMRPGVALLAAMSGVPTVPGIILGSERLYNKKNWLPWRRPKVWIAYGKAIPAPDSSLGEEGREQFLCAFSESIASLKGRLIADYGLTEDDMPHSPQQRMAEA